MPWEIPDEMAVIMKQNFTGVREFKQSNSELVQHHRNLVVAVWLLRQDPSVRRAFDRDTTMTGHREKILTILRHLLDDIVADSPASVMAEIQQQMKDPEFTLQLHNSFFHNLQCQEYAMKLQLILDHIGGFREWISMESYIPDTSLRRKRALVLEPSTLLGEISDQLKNDYENFQEMNLLAMKCRRLNNAIAKVRKLTESFMKSWREEVTKAAGRTTSERFLNWYFSMTKRLSMDVEMAREHGYQEISRNEQFSADIQVLRSKIDEAKRLFDADRTLARVCGRLEEFDQRPYAEEEKNGWVKTKYAREFHGAYIEFLEKNELALPFHKYFVMAVKGVEVPDVFSSMDGYKKRWLSEDWKKGLKAGLCQKLEEIDATREVHWHPVHFLADVIPGIRNDNGEIVVSVNEGWNQASVPSGMSDGTSLNAKRINIKTSKREKKQQGTANEITISSVNNVSCHNENENCNHQKKVGLQSHCLNEEGSMAKGKSESTESDADNANDQRLPSKPLRQCSLSHCGKSKLKSEVFVCAACVKHASLPYSQPFKKAYYCDSTCQLDDWRERHSVFHKKLSKEWKRLNRQCSYIACGRRAADIAEDAPEAKLRVCEGCRDYTPNKDFQKAYYCCEMCRLADWEEGHAQIHEDFERKCQVVQQQAPEDLYDVE